MQGNILFVDLTNKSARVAREPELFEQFLGGTAAATEMLIRLCPPSTDPLAPENPIILATGPFSAIFPVATKTVALFKSPLTGELGESHAGGRLVAALREADIDMLVITGKADAPTFFTIDDHTVNFHSARTVWGKSALAADRILREFEPHDGRKSSIVRIGPAGERLSPISGATVDASRHFGRLGLGAVFGSKNLKGFLISGSGGQTIEKPDLYRKVYDAIHEKVVKSGDMRKYHDLGTAGNIETLNAIGGLPTRNFSQGFFEGAAHISGEKFARDVLIQHTACAHCPCGCIHVAELREEFKPFHFRTAKVPYDFELIFALGSTLSLDSPDAILKLILAVEKEGWDAMSMGNTLAWASEAFLTNVIDTEETDGLPIRFGDVNGYLEALGRIASGHNEFFADLERGTAFCTAKYGGKDFGLHFGKLEPAGYLTGENALMTWIAGVRHSHLDDMGYSIDQKLLGKETSLEEQVRQQVKDAQWRMVTNSLVTCLFARGVYDDATIVSGLEAIDCAWSLDDLKALGERTLRRKHEWKKSCGYVMEDTLVPEKLLRVRSATGSFDAERIAKRVALYREYAGI